MLKEAWCNYHLLKFQPFKINFTIKYFELIYVQWTDSLFIRSEVFKVKYLTLRCQINEST